MIKREDGTIFSIKETSLKKGLREAKREKIYTSTKLDVIAGKVKDLA
jgi:hypothetical protein